MADYTSPTSSNPSTSNNNAWTISNMSSTYTSPVSATSPLDGFTQRNPQAPILSLALAVDINASPASIDDTNIITGTPALFDSLNPDVNTIAASTNTIAPQDFCLYERMDPSAFDFPLFGESFKQQKLKQGGLFQNQLTDEELTLALDMQQHQQMEQLRYIQSHAIGSDGLSTAEAGPSFDEHPLISADMGLSSPMATSASSNKVSFGFDSLAALMDDSALDLSHVAAAVKIQAQVSFHDRQLQQHQEQTQVYYTPVHASDTPLLDAPSTPCLNSPFSPSLDTPAMPHLDFKFGGDFGCGDQTPLFGSGGPMFPFQLPMPIQFGHVMQSRGSGMVAPQSTLLNASPNPPAPLTFGGLCETECNLITSSTSSSLHIKKEEEDTAKISLSSLSDLSSSSNSLLLSDSDDSEDDDDDDMDFKDETEDDDVDYFDSKSSAPDHSAATSSSNTVVSFVYSGKRKINDAPRPAAPIALERLPSVSGGDNDSEIDADDHQADSNYIPVATFIHNRKRKSKATPAPASPFKRTRPTLASHHGGNNGSSSSSSSSFATAKQQFDVETGSLSPLSNQDDSGNLLPAQQSSNKRTPNKRRSPSSDSYRPFVCDHPDCGRAFNRLFNLRSHVRTHDPNSERPFICEEDDCKKAFTRKHDLQRHQTSVHQGQRRYVCDTCKKSFSRQDGLRRHYRREVNSCGPGRFEGVEGEDDHVGYRDEDDDDFSDASDTENRHSAT